MEIYQEFTFDAAHRFPGVPEGHPYYGLHGHSFVARIVLAGRVDPATGFVADLGEVEARCKALRERLDHKYLNDVDGLKVPSLENIAVWIWEAWKCGASPAVMAASTRETRPGPRCEERSG